MDEARRCRGTSKQAHRRCKRAAIVGGNVCHFHGGAAPQVQASARARLAALVDPALDELRRLIASADSDAVKLAAARDVLDRAGYKATEKIQSDGKVLIEVQYIDHPLPAANGHVAENSRR